MNLRTLKPLEATEGGTRGMRIAVVAEVTRAGFRHVTTMTRWPPDGDRDRLFLVMFEKP